MKIFKLVVFTLVVLASETVLAQSLREAVGKYCLIGAAVNQWQSDGQVPKADAVLQKHFNCAVAENCMKPEVLAPAEGIFDFRVADKFVDYCQRLNLKVNGHCLVWHSQAPDWWFTNGYNASPASKEVLKERLIKHIKTVVGHFKGKVCWEKNLLRLPSVQPMRPTLMQSSTTTTTPCLSLKSARLYAVW